MNSESFVINNSIPVYVEARSYDPVAVLVSAGQTAYYGTSSNADTLRSTGTSLAQGASVTLTEGRWFVANTATSRLELSDADALPFPVANRSELALNAKDPAYGPAKGDAKILTDGAITSGTAILASASGTWSSADAGKVAIVNGAGAAGVPLVTTISSVQSATQVTLASNASTTVSGARAVYGTDDTTAIQSLIDAASTTGTLLGLAAIEFSPGARYLVSTLRPKSNVDVLGWGATLVKNPTSSDAIISNISSGATLNTVSHFRVFGLTFTGEGQTVGAADSSSRRAATRIYNCDHMVFDHCTVTDMQHSGIWLQNVQGCQVTNCTLENVCATGPNPGNGINIAFDSSATVGTPQSTTDVVITGNTVKGCQSSSICVTFNYNNNAFNPFVPALVRISQNNCSSSSFGTIALEVGVLGSAIRRATIDHNTVEQTGAFNGGYAGIQITNNGGGTGSTDKDELQKITVDHNIVDSSDQGILCWASRVAIDHNIVSAGRDGIALNTNSTNTPEHQTVDNNIVNITNGAGHGISANGSASPTIRGNKVFHTTGLTGNGDGINVVNCSRPKIHGNSTEYAPRNGVLAQNCTNVSCSLNFIYNPSESSSGNGSGIYANQIDKSGSAFGARSRFILNEVVDDRGTAKTYTAFNNSGSNQRMELSYNRFIATSNGWTVGGPIVAGSGVAWQFANITDIGSQPAYPAAITVTASPFTFTNSNAYPVLVAVAGGTVSSTVRQRVDSGHQVTMPNPNGEYYLQPLDALIVTYTAAPTMTQTPVLT